MKKAKLTLSGLMIALIVSLSLALSQTALLAWSASTTGPGGKLSIRNKDQKKSQKKGKKEGKKEEKKENRKEERREGKKTERIEEKKEEQKGTIGIKSVTNQTMNVTK